MNDAQMRVELINCYANSPSWKVRVMNMSESQVQAIFLRFKREGKIK